MISIADFERIEPRRDLAILALMVVLSVFAANWDMSPVNVVALAVMLVGGCAFPRSALLAAVVMLPWFYRPLGIGSLEFPTSEILLLAAALGTGADALKLTFRRSTRWLGDELVAITKQPLLWAAAALMLLALVLALFPIDRLHRAESLREFRWVFFEPFLLVLLMAWHNRRRSLAKSLAIALIAGAALASLWALASFAIGGGVAVGGVRRIATPYPHPNALALLSTRVLVLAVAWLVYARATRWTVWLVPTVIGITVLSTFSRGALLGLGFAGLVLLLALPRRQRIMAIGAGATLLLAMVALARDRMLDLFGGGTGSHRLDIWRSALDMIAEHPVRGYGPDQFLYAYLPRMIQPSSWSERFTAHAHNFVLDFWVRLGLLGVVFILIAALLLALTLWRRVGSEAQTNALATAALLALLASFAHGLVDNAFFAHDLAMSAWILVWIAFNAQQPARHD